MAAISRKSKPVLQRLACLQGTLVRFASHLCGQRISQEDFNKTKVKVVEASQQCLRARFEEVGSWKRAPSSAILKTKHSSSGEFMAWRGAPIRDPMLKKSGELELLNRDKLDGLVSAIALGYFPYEAMQNVALYDEGCDNGDILGYALPWLIKSQVHTGVVLTNGHPKKLELASQFSNWITNNPRLATAYVHNAFDKRIIGGQNLKPLDQKVFMIFHLGIVERPAQISKLLERRFRVMQPQDIVLLTLLLKDSRSDEILTKEHSFCLDFSKSLPGTTIYQKSLPAAVKSQLSQEGVHGQEQDYYISTFSPEDAVNLIETSGGTILTGTTSEAPVEGRGGNVTYMNFVLRKS
jgi:hypothetical protein